MKCTSAEAAKILRQLNEDYSALLGMESKSMDFIAALNEDVESVRPKYDYEETQKKLAGLENKIRTVKHAINVFNTTHIIPEFNMTIDQMLIYLPQLSQRKDKLYMMKNRLPKTREKSSYSGSNIIDYRIVNYDIEAAEADYNEAAELLSKAQTALDLINTTETMEIDI
ncbi:MAG: hypothetical protein J1E40_08710 [Oscillospiraceae bacterium]|nr:hypothetical protein [Oscillospiraceae bacterium]